MSEYRHLEIEKKWQEYWDKNETFKTNVWDFSKPKFYALDMFPYPSGHGLHVGHPEGYTASDIVSRMRRMQGYNVLHPMGWDAFGLPAEQYAIKTGNHPDGFTQANIATFKRQLKMLGFSFDWSKEISTCDPKYYKWTQWIFKQLYNAGLAKQIDMPVNWCEELGTVLANDEVIDGKSERGGFPVVRKNMKQWVMDIPAYAEKLIDGLSEIDWPESTKEMQKNWIGKSVGAHINFKVKGTKEVFTVFTTRADTLFGATYCTLAPEHKLVDIITTPEQKEVEGYCYGYAKSTTGVVVEPYAFYLTAGQHTITLKTPEQSVAVAALVLAAPENSLSYEELSKDDIILIETFENEVRFADIVRPVASKIEIGVVGEAEREEYNADDAISGNDFVHVVLNYDNNLKKMGSTVSVVAKVNGIDASTVSVVENVVWDTNSPKVVEFDFKPSMLYANGDVIFSFELDGLVSAGINNDDTLARPAYIKVDYSDRKFDFASQNTNVWKQYEMPYLESGFSSLNIVLKDSVLQTVDAKNENLMLVSTAIDKVVQNKIAVQSAEEYFYGLKFVANGKIVRLAEGYVNVVFPFENDKQYSDLKDKDIKVFVYDENGENEQEVDAIVTKYGIVASTSQMGNFKVVYVFYRRLSE